jgi:hypothetical protein
MHYDLQYNSRNNHSNRNSRNSRNNHNSRNSRNNRNISKFDCVVNHNRINLVMTHLVVDSDFRHSTPQSKDIIQKVEKEFQTSHPKTWALIDEIYRDIIEKNVLRYSLMCGNVQSGKTLGMTLLTWRLAMNGYYPIIITLNLREVGNDFISKIRSEANGVLASIIDHICKDAGLSEEERTGFHLKPLKMLDMRDKTFLTNYDCTHVPVLLMNTQNFKQFGQFYSHLQTHIYSQTATQIATNRKPVIIVDEVHKLYTGTKSWIKEIGLVKETQQSGRAMLNWLYKKAASQQSHLIGVTATPERVLVDSHCRPGHIYRLPVEAPCVNMRYHGWCSIKGKLVNIEPQIYDSNIMEVLKQIIDRPRINIALVPLALITTECLNAEQEVMCNAIKAKFADMVYARVINQEQDLSIHEFFRDCLVDGNPKLLVMIANRVVQAGVSVKPAVGTYCVSTNTVNTNCKNVTVGTDCKSVNQYAVGITDQIVNLSNNGKACVENDMQFMRIFGWYPIGHPSYLWLPDRLSLDRLVECFKINDDLISKYDGSIGSVSNIVSEVRVGKICGGDLDLYCHTDAANVNSIQIDRVNLTVAKMTSQMTSEITSQMTDWLELETEIIKVDLADLAKELGLERISDFFKHASQQRKLREAIFKQIGATEKFQIPYTANRMEAILRHSCQPSDNDQWQINGFLWGPTGESSLLAECWVVRFKEAWDMRPTLDDIAKCMATDANRANNLTHLYFKCGKDELIAGSHKLHNMSLRHNEMTDCSLSKTHHEVLDELDAILIQVKKGERTLNGWILFRKVYRNKLGRASISVHGAAYRLFKKNNPNVVKELQHLVESDLSLDLKIDKANSLIVLDLTRH